MLKTVTLVFLVLAAHLAAADNVAFFYALGADLQGLKENAQENGQPLMVGTHSIHRLRLGSHTIHAVKMGSGPVETASAAQALLARFRCDWAFSVGPAGTLSSELSPGTWARAERIVAWQRVTAGAAGDVAAKSSDWKLDWTRLPVTNLPSIWLENACLSVASGEAFIASDSERARLRAVTEADAVDMNSFGLAAVCADHKVPLFIWKIISDRADGTAAEDFRTFVSEYKGDGGRALADVIRALPPNPSDPASYPAIERLMRED